MTSTTRIVGTGVAWNTIASVLVKVLAIINVFVVLKHLSVYDYGVIQLVLTVTSTIGGLMLPGLSSVLISDLARDRGAGDNEHAGALARQYFILQLVLSAVAFAILFFGSSIFATHLNQPTIAYYLRIASFSFLAGSVRNILTTLSLVELRFVYQSVLSILDEGVKLVLLVALFWWLHLGAAGVLYAMSFAPFVVVLLALPWSFPLLRPLVTARSAVEPWWKLLTGHRFWGMASAYLTTLNQNARLWLIQLFLGTEAVGLFSFAQGLVSQAGALITFASIATPVLAQAAHDAKRLAELGTRALKYHLWIALAGLIPGMIITPFFIHYLFPAYDRATVITLIMLVTLIPSAANVATSALYPALQLQREYFFRATLLKSISLFIFSVPLMLLFGITGASLEPVITISLSSAERVRALRTRIPGFVGRLRSVVVFNAGDRAVLEQVFLKRFRRVS